MLFLFRSLISYSDGCSGQNKNHTLLYYYIDLSKRGTFETLEHRYMVCGHSRTTDTLPSLRRARRVQQSHLPKDWAPVLEGAKMMNLFKLPIVEQSDFKDWKTFLGKKYRLATKDLNGDPVCFQNTSG